MKAVILIWAYFIGAWVVNLTQFAGCDFAAPYKQEVTHGIGVFAPPIAAITVWL